MTLKEARKMAGMTQNELAKLSGVNPRTIQKIESGESDIKNATFGTVRALANALAVDIVELDGEKCEGNIRIRRIKDVLTQDALEDLSPSECRMLFKGVQAREYSGWSCYPGTCSAIFDRIPDQFWDRYSAKHIGEVAALLKVAYDDGVHRIGKTSEP